MEIYENNGVNYFLQNAPSKMFDFVLNTPTEIKSDIPMKQFHRYKHVLSGDYCHYCLDKEGGFIWFQ